MEIVLIAVVAVAIGAFIYYNRSSKGLDVNNDGKVDVNDAKVVVEATKKVTRKAKQKVLESVEKVKKPRKSKQ